MWALTSWTKEGPLRDLGDSPVSVELEPISSDTQFDRVVGEAQQLEELVAIVWYVYWLWELVGFLVSLFNLLTVGVWGCLNLAFAFCHLNFCHLNAELFITIWASAEVDFNFNFSHRTLTRRFRLCWITEH